MQVKVARFKAALESCETAATKVQKLPLASTLPRP